MSAGERSGSQKDDQTTGNYGIVFVGADHRVVGIASAWAKRRQLCRHMPSGPFRAISLLRSPLLCFKFPGYVLSAIYITRLRNNRNGCCLSCMKM